MDGYEDIEAAVASVTVGARVSALPRLVQVSTSERQCDDVRQLVVAVWARAKLLERLLTGQTGIDAVVLTGLAEIGVAIDGITARLDELEDGLVRRAA